MSLRRTKSPCSPRTPKIQQQNWDDRRKQLLDLGVSTGDNTNESGNSSGIQLHHSPTNQPRIRRSPVSPRTYNYVLEAQQQQQQQQQQHQQQQRSYDETANIQVPPKSPKIITTSSGGDGDPNFLNESNCCYYSPRSSPKSPRKFVFDAVSPKFEGKKFEYYQPITPDENDDKPVNNFPDPMERLINDCSQMYTNKHRCPSGSGGGGDKNQQTNDLIKYDYMSSVPTNSSLSGGDTSDVTTIITGTDNTSNTTSSNKTDKRIHSRRRQAVNITSNPGYQSFHNSHCTLDRTCSDSVVSLASRKSTSDLTSDAVDPQTVGAKPRRRGSSKGGLAYLVNRRRNSRDLIKNAESNNSLCSNEDIGPLAFQATTRGRQRRTSNFLELPVHDHIRPRVCSLPEHPYNPRQSDDLYRLRTFSISKGTVVNCGDSIISRRSRSNTSVNSTMSRASERSPFDGSCCGRGYKIVDSLPPSPTESEDPPPPTRYRVVMLGSSGVGKTALVNQFMTSEYMNTYDASLDDEFGEKTVSILLDGEESEMIFIDHPSTEMSAENALATYEPHGCVVVYSVVDNHSFTEAKDIIKYLWCEKLHKEKAIILVGNKADLARSRQIMNEAGKNLALHYDVKFIETSSGIQHNVDELLVGILKQIRLKIDNTTKMRSSKTHLSLNMAKEILQKICLNDISKSKSCENLHVL